MNSKLRYEELKKEYGDVSSWAIWAYPGNTPKSNTDDMSVFEDKELIKKLNPKYVFIGLNGSSTHGNEGAGVRAKRDDVIPWGNFHSGYSYQNDYKIRYALMGTKYWGAYITDVIKRYAEVDSSKLKAYLKEHPEKVEEDVIYLRQELDLLGCKPILIAFGNDAYNIVNRYFGGEYEVKKVIHYSHQIGKEKYREHVLDVLNNC